MAHPAPAMPAVQSEVSRMWKLRFKRGTNPDCWVIFNYPGDLVAAIGAAREWCHRRDLKFLHVELALVDISAPPED